MKIASRGEERECRRSLWIVEDLKNKETTFFKAAASQLQESCSRFKSSIQVDEKAQLQNLKYPNV